MNRSTLCAAVLLAACSAGDAPRTDANAALGDGSAQPATNTTDVIRSTVDDFPRLGVAILEGPRNWCVAFAPNPNATPVTAGQRVMVVFPMPAPVAALDGKIGAERRAACATNLPQPSWAGYAFYGIELIDSMPTALDRVPKEAVVAVSDARWRRGADDVVRASLDAAGALEELRTCVGEGARLFTLWSPGQNGARVQRWQATFALGTTAESTCSPGDTGS